MLNQQKLRFIDLFAGIGGIRLGFEQACASRDIETECVFTSEIKRHAIDVLKLNHPNEVIHGDITKVPSEEIPDFDVLLAGFPCQAFSFAGKRLGFMDTRGTMFFEVERILRDKRPKGFILENVEGLVNHDRVDKHDKIGRTLSTILEHLKQLGYQVEWRVLSSADFGVAQNRKRIYIVGTINAKPSLDNFNETHSVLNDVLEHGKETSSHPFVKLLLDHYTAEQLEGKGVNDKRGGNDNIHSWDLDYRGNISEEEKKLMSLIMTERRKKKWAKEYGIDWMDGMPLTVDMISTFYSSPNLQEMLNHLTKLGYLRHEHPKKLLNGRRVYDEELPCGYNIVAGKMSYEVTKILNSHDITPTLVATDMSHLYVNDNGGLRRLTIREGLRLFGYPEDFMMIENQAKAYDLLGNTVVVPVIKAVSERVLDVL